MARTVSIRLAPTYAQALSEGQHYLAQYQQDGPHTLELRRVEVLPPGALPLPQGGGGVMSTSFTYSTAVEVELTMEQLAGIIVHLGSDQQARLISLMAEVDFSVPSQLQYITDDDALTPAGRRLMELIGAYARPLPSGEVEA